MRSRIERRGKVAPLSPRFVRFMREAMGGVPLDDVEHPSQMRPDLSCLRGLLIVELKSLEEDASKRVANLTEEIRKRPDWPDFLGSWPITSVIRNMDEPEALKQKYADRIGRAIVSHLRKANKQLAAHAVRHPRLNQVRLVVFINEDHEVYDPAVTVFTISKALARRNGGKPKYESIDGVLYLTQRHALQDGKHLAHPMITITGPAMEDSPWKGDVLDLVGRKWSRWIGADYITREPSDVAAFVNSFTTIEHIPEQMQRQESWSLDYRRHPYMRSWSFDELRDYWDDMYVFGALAFIEGSPLKPIWDDKAKFIEKFSHLIDEIAHRGLHMQMFEVEPSRIVVAASSSSFALRRLRSGINTSLSPDPGYP